MEQSHIRSSHLIFVLFLFISSCSAACNYSDPTKCTSSGEACQWVTTLGCSQIEECGDKSAEECMFDRFCIYQQSETGYCSPTQFNCGISTSPKSCLKKKNCLWQSKQYCTSIVTAMPNCSALSAWECAKNSAFCQLDGQCFDNRSICANYTKEQCLAHPNLCHYTLTQKESCQDNPAVCNGLTAEQCRANKKKCIFIQTSKDQCVNDLECSAFPATNCPTRLCTVTKTPFTCTTQTSVDCKALSPNECALNKACAVNADGVCGPRAMCESITDESICKELAASGVCIYTQTSAVCSNTISCSAFSSQGESACESQIGCHFIPGDGTCTPRKFGCAQLNASQCHANKNCIHIHEAGYCSNNKYGCENLSPEECLTTKRCKLDYQCTQLHLLACEAMSIDQCWQTPYCQVKDAGYCYDRPIDCPQNPEKCKMTKYCNWIGEVTESCTNRYDCQSMTPKQCKLNPSICLQTSTGSCQPLIVVDPTDPVDPSA